jgi:hypothetical protein
MGVFENSQEAMVGAGTIFNSNFGRAFDCGSGIGLGSIYLYIVLK